MSHYFPSGSQNSFCRGFLKGFGLQSRCFCHRHSERLDKWKLILSWWPIWASAAVLQLFWLHICLHTAIYTGPGLYHTHWVSSRINILGSNMFQSPGLVCLKNAGSFQNLDESSDHSSLTSWLGRTVPKLTVHANIDGSMPRGTKSVTKSS